MRTTDEVLADLKAIASPTGTEDGHQKALNLLNNRARVEALLNEGAAIMRGEIADADVEIVERAADEIRA